MATSVPLQLTRKYAPLCKTFSTYRAPARGLEKNRVARTAVQSWKKPTSGEIQSTKIPIFPTLGLTVTRKENHVPSRKR